MGEKGWFIDRSRGPQQPASLNCLPCYIPTIAVREFAIFAQILRFLLFMVIWGFTWQLWLHPFCSEKTSALYISFWNFKHHFVGLPMSNPLYGMCLVLFPMLFLSIIFFLLLQMPYSAWWKVEFDLKSKSDLHTPLMGCVLGLVCTVIIRA